MNNGLLIKIQLFILDWDLNIVPQILIQLCIKQVNNDQTKSFHSDIKQNKERLLYYPIYVINYQYGSQTDFTCLVDGITGQVTGDRQYSMTKVTLATLVCFYLAALIALGSLIGPSVGIALASLFSFKTSIPLALILSPLVRRFAKNYPKISRQRISQQQWIKFITIYL